MQGSFYQALPRGLSLKFAVSNTDAIPTSLPTRTGRGVGTFSGFQRETA